MLYTRGTTKEKSITMIKHKLTRSILWVPLLLLLSQPLLAQISLPRCTTEIADFHQDRTNDNDGAAGTIDIDKDDDGLIEICDLEGLSEMRYQLDGSGYKASADATKITYGCPATGCRGYELVKDLDFNDAASYRTTSNQVTWTTGDGWSPIGSDSNRFNSVFEGNGFMIAHLYINQSNVANVGLFSVVDAAAQIQNIRLSDMNVKGQVSVGGLVGINHGIIINSNVTGTAKSVLALVGGLVGENNNPGEIISSLANVNVEGLEQVGGLVGNNRSLIQESSASGRVEGDTNIGGLVGGNEFGLIINIYATGMVSGDSNVGGLAGSNRFGLIINSYAIGMVTGNSNTGGLIGSNTVNESDGEVTASYWDTGTTGQATSDGGDGRTNAELQSPTVPGTTSTEIYYGWREDVWYFGGADDYPRLLFAVPDRDSDGDGFPNNDSAGNRVDIDRDGDGLIEIYDLEGLNAMRYQLDGSGYRASADATKITEGCPASGCIGYELMRSLSFTDDNSYADIANKAAWTVDDYEDDKDNGWKPIGARPPFTATFEGNHYTIANLMINRQRTSSNLGLFGRINESRIINVGVLNINIHGGHQIGGLVGSSFGGSIIAYSYATGVIEGGSSLFGGLTGTNAGSIINSWADVAINSRGSDVGGLAGRNQGWVINSYATGAVVGHLHIGGLVGANDRGFITNCYATGAVRGFSFIGGLVGSNLSHSITNCYATGAVVRDFGDLEDPGGDIYVGGLVAFSPTTDNIISGCYWDTTTSIKTSIGGDGRTTTELQSPTAPGTTPTQVYYGWSEDIWDFGSNTDYPRLRLTIDSDGDLVDDTIDIDDDNNGLIEVRNIDDLHEIRFQHDGSGKKQHADDQKNTSGCPSWGCRGYELARSLDFNDANSYRDYTINRGWTVEDYSDDSDHGWHPLPDFRTIFNGNGFIIRNLQINRVNEHNVGLFAAVHQLGRVENVELVHPNIRGRSNVGGLVGNNSGVVINSYVRDYDTDVRTRDTSKYIEAIEGSVGGLVGRNNGGGESIGDIINSGTVINVQIKEDTSADGINANAGGLAGFNLNSAEIINSYARGTVKGPCGVGGLTANNFSTVQSDPDRNSKIINSYATGDLITGFGNCNVAGNVRSGGLAAVNSGLISNSYTRSCWESGSTSVANTRRGGIVQDNSGTIINSYYQTTACNGLQQTPSGSNKTQTELQEPVTTGSDFPEIYQAWHFSEWDFGNNSQYPVIRYTPGPDKDNPGCGYDGLPDCAALLKHQLPAERTVTYTDAPVASIQLAWNLRSPFTGSDSPSPSLKVPQNPDEDFLEHPNKNEVASISSTSIFVSGFSDRPNPMLLQGVEDMQGEQDYIFNFIPVLSLPDSPTTPSQPSNGSNVISGFTSVEVAIGGSSKATKLVPAFSNTAFNYDVYFQSDYANTRVTVDIPDSISNTVNSEVNGSPATFTDDGAMLVRLGDTVRVNTEGNFVIEEGINLPLEHGWYISSGPTLFSGELRGESISFNINNGLFSNSQSGDAVLTLELRDKYTATAAATKQISIRILDRLVLTSGYGEVLQDQADKTLHRVVLAPDQPQTAITARSLNQAITLAVDDSDAQVSAENGDGTAVVSNITVQLDDDSKTEFTITATDSDGTSVTHTVRVFRRSGVLSLQNIEIEDITFDEAISAPGSYTGMLPIRTTATESNQIIVTAGETNAINIRTITVDEDGDGTHRALGFTTDKNFAEPGTQLTATFGDSFNLMAGSVITITVRTRVDLNNEDIYTVEIENTPIIDDNYNGLIDIYTLEDLDEIRNQYVNMPRICGMNGDITCHGFELRRSLDFNAADSYQNSTINTVWTTGRGWTPIGDGFFHFFNRVFEGNGHTISDLYINNNVGGLYGLFSQLHADGVIKNVGLLDAYIRGGFSVGGLVGENLGLIINSYATGDVKGNDRIGGLVGESFGSIINSYATAVVNGSFSAGGLVGFNSGSIISSFAYADVIGATVGGLIGENHGHITNTYAAGTVSSAQTVAHTGGLVGWNTFLGEIKNSYAISRMMPLTDVNSQVRGLVGQNEDGRIIASYWDKTVNADLTITNGAKTTAELQTPTAPGATSADTYYGWRAADWDFGDNFHYPTLYYATTDGITVSTCADSPTPSSALPRCGSRIPNQAVRDLILALEVSEIMISSQPVANADYTINEGSNVRLMVNVADGSKSYRYAWSQISSQTLVLTTTNTATLNVAIPPDFIELDETTAAVTFQTAAVTFQVEVSDDFSTIQRRETITIQKIDNGNPRIKVDVNPSRLRAITTTADIDGAGSFSYQWQQLIAGEWMNITDATTATYWLPPAADDRIQYRLEIEHTDGQGYTTNYTQGPLRIRFDDDGDGLIDIYTLENLDTIRHQYSNMPSRCGSNGDIVCDGFELRSSLDFNAADSYQSGVTDPNWTTRSGWMPIGGDALSNRFNSVFEGNGHTISGLLMNREQSHQGLFTVLGADGEIKNVGLLDVAVHGSSNVGSLVGKNYGSIINSYATGKISGSGHQIGGLVGENGYGASILSSFANVNVSAASIVGGLVGLHSGRITNSYAAGTVSNTSIFDASLGGLVGVGRSDGEIINSYAISRVIPASEDALDVGGLVGVTTGTVIASYWDTETSEQQSSAGDATSRTTMELQSPIFPGARPTDTYYGWSDTVWYFGSNQTYPALRYVAGGLNACNADMSTLSALPQCGSLLPNQESAERVPLAIPEVAISSQPAANNDATINEGSNVRLMVNATGGSGVYSYVWSQTSGKALVLTTTNTATLNVTIPPDFIALAATMTTVTFQVGVNDSFSTTYSSKIITIKKIDNGSLDSANADITSAQLRIIPTGTDPDGAAEVFSYQWQQQELGGAWEDISTATMATYLLPTDVSASVNYRATISYIDGQGYFTEYQSVPLRGRLDDDNDGLIDIYTLEDLDNIRNQHLNMPSTCAAGNAEQCRGFELRRSLDFNAVDSYQSNTINTLWTTGSGWAPIGGTAANSFSRIFEGNGHTISGLRMDRFQNYMGLFAQLTSNEIKNVGLLDVDVKGNDGFYIGGLVGSNRGSIINSYVTGAVSGEQYVGGLAGRIWRGASIINSYATAAVTGTSNYIGGLVGRSRGDIMNSYATAAVTGTSNYIGGLVGQNENEANIINSYASGAVSGNSEVGGLVGWNENEANIINSYASGAVSGTSNIGGLIGLHQGRLSNTYATGNVSLTSEFDNSVGGLVGHFHWFSEDSIRNSYAIGRVIPGVDNARNAGGLIGTTTGTAIGLIGTTTGTAIGLIGTTTGTTIGLIGTTIGTAISSYWDAETSEWLISAGGATSRTTVELQSPIAPGTTATDVYYGWHNNDWDFGSRAHYPALRYVAGGLNACNADMSTLSTLPQCGSLLPNRERGALEVSEVAISSQPVANNDSTINEGSNVRLMVNTMRGSGIYHFVWSQTSGQVLVLTTTNTATLNIAIAPDFIAEDATTTTVTFAVIVDDGISTISRSKMITITKAPLAISGVVLSTATIAEGSTATVTFDVSGGTGIYQYAYRLIAGADEIVLPPLPPPVNLMIPNDIVAAADREQVAEFSIIVRDDGGRIGEHNDELTLEKVDNGLANIEASRATSRTLTVKIGSDPDGDAATPTYAYQWQWRAAATTAQWVTIAGAEDASYTISDDLAVINNEFRVRVIYTDGQGYRNEDGFYSNAILYDFLPLCTMAIEDSDGDDVDATIDIDKDGDGLIELCDLEGINEMRYQLDGNGYKTSENATSSRRGCPLVDGEEQCRGYELVRSLDFNIAESYRANTTTNEWIAGRGWLPITTGFASVFEGNGHSIANLYINQTEAASGSEQGLFATLAATSQINNIQLLDVNIKGFARVAALSGSNSGIISNSFASGEVMANTDVGGLVGRNDGSVVSGDANVEVNASMNGGGLIGHNQGSVRDSHADAQVMGGSRLGGISGFNNGSIISSYTTATVIGTDTNSHDIGGLVGHNQGLVRDSHADAQVMGDSRLGGISGFNNGSIINSYTTATVIGTDTSSYDIGGLVGHNQGSVRDSHADGRVMGGNRLGGLNGFNNGSIISSHATVTVSGTDTNSHDIGGLIGRNNNVIANSYATGTVTGSGNNIGGLVGRNNNTIANSYASGGVTVTGNNIGGLVGFNSNGRIVNTYAEGTVMGVSQVGGLIGRHHGSLRDSYAALGAVSGSGSDIGGLIGMMSTTATVTASYWDSDTSEQVSSAGGEGRTTAELQTAIAPGTTTTAVYYNWSDNDWDFGDNHHYPALRYASDDNLNRCVIDITTSTTALPCTLLLPDQRDRDKGLATIFFFSDDLSTAVTPAPPFSPLTDNYTITIVTLAENIRFTLRPYAINANATIAVTDQTDKSYVAEKANGALSDEIVLNDEITLSIVVTDILAGDTVHTTYTFTIISEPPPLRVSDIKLNMQPPANADGTINEGSTATITFEVNGGTGVYQYASKIDDAAYTPFELPFMYSITDDLVAADVTSQTVKLTIRVSDQASKVEAFEHTEALHIRKTNKGSADINVSITTATLTVTIGADPDGDATTPNYQYQWQSQAIEAAPEWMDIDDATEKSYTISGDLASAGGEFRVQVTYTDGQGYQATLISNEISYTPPAVSGLRIRTKVFLEGPLR